jgi:intracellular multiplication protein IcmK
VSRHVILALACLAAPALAWAQGPVQPNDPAAGTPTPDAAQRAVRDAIPITPEMIRELARRLGENQRAQEESVAQIASPVSRPIKVTFAPGQATSIVQTVKGYPSQLAFFDATGQPWPIVWDTNSNSAGGGGGSTGNCNTSSGGPGGGGPAVEAVGFHVCVPVKGSNVLQVTPMSLSPRGGLLVSLQGAPKALTFLVVAGRDRYDADLSVLVDRRGPNARVQIDTRPGVPVTGAAYLTAMLAGVAPAEARPLQVEGVSPDEVRAWRMGGETYLRTRHTLMSPPWSATESGEGDVRIYALPSTPIVLLSVNGRTVSASLKD